MAADLPLISIIITNFNYAAYLAEAIGSALAQTHKGVEVIVVDDGSTDGSREVIAGFDGIRALYQVNQGQTGAAMAGLAVARGNIILFLDADDGLLPHACAEIARAYDRDIALYQFVLEKRGPDGRVMGRLPERPFLARGHAGHVVRHGDFPSAPTSGNAFSATHCRKMFGLLQPQDRRHFFDGFLIFSAPFSGRVVALESVLGFYRVHGANVSRPGWGRAALRHNVGNALWQRRGIALARGGVAGAGAGFAWLSPHQLRSALALQRLGERDILAGQGLLGLGAALVTRTLCYQGLSMRARLRLLAACLALMVLPQAVLARIWPGFGQ